ncbi:hypothetical protein O3M35_001050 [Rhynocoris fuscipes]|uniref:DRBM domain-containing protein n=1 Tax=Rhynocoris fuscipes TaxID=488301 RepID=A0AAW1DNT1_9HEMI
MPQRKFTKRIIKTAKDTNKKEKEPSEFKKVKEPDEGNLEFEKPLDEGVSESALTISSLSNEDKDGPVTPTSFLEAFASKRGLTLQFADISFKSTPFVKEYIVSCKLDTMGAEGKGRTKIIARETAASELIRLMLGKMKRSQMPPQIGSFTDQEKKLSLLLSCEFINYEKQLNNLVSGMNTTRTPQYAPIFNTPPGQFSFRCKALGYNAVGTGRTKEIAKRMGAKLLMDRIEDQREKYYVSKYGEKKARKFLKIR